MKRLPALLLGCTVSLLLASCNDAASTLPGPPPTATVPGETATPQPAPEQPAPEPAPAPTPTPSPDPTPTPPTTGPEPVPPVETPDPAPPVTAAPDPLQFDAAQAAYLERAAALPATPPEALAPLGAVTDLLGLVPALPVLDPLLPNPVRRAPQDAPPIILVHGFIGFGRDEAGGALRYWGGTQDIQDDLRAQGYRVFTASMGPVSSNWDRAAELFAQIKGGCVNYGAAHSAEFGHAVTDARKCYDGFYPEWDAEHPVNLIGHSMGGPTSRVLIKLLEDGSPENRSGDPASLFAGGKEGWVRNLMTISAVNTGSTAAESIDVFAPFVKSLVLALATTTGVLPDNLTYDFDLGQWGLERGAGEGFLSYLDRVFKSRVFASKDQAFNDLRPGAQDAQNRWAGLPRATALFSWDTLSSVPGALSGWHYPIPDAQPLTLPLAYPYPQPRRAGLGNFTGQSGALDIGAAWWANDGLANVVSMGAPLNVGARTERYAGQPAQRGQGVWYDLGTLNGYDHFDVIGLFGLNPVVRPILPFYRQQAEFLKEQR